MASPAQHPVEIDTPPSQQDAACLALNTRIYGLWPENKSWYWGYIIDRRKMEGDWVYQLRFDDGDERVDCVLEVDFVVERVTPKKQGRKGLPSPQRECVPSRAWVPPPEVGSRCTVRHIDNQLHTGRVLSCTGGDYFKCSVLFDDSEFREGIEFWEIVAATPCSDPVPPRPIPSALPCGQCQHCQVPDCGVCFLCKSNAERTRRTKLVCMRKPCPLQEFCLAGTQSWTYYVQDPTKDLLKDAVVFRNGKTGRQKPPPVGLEILRSLFEDDLGVPWREPVRHVLVGEKVRQKWVDRNGRTQETYGTIRACFRRLYDQSLMFDVQYDLKRPWSPENQPERPTRSLPEQAVFGCLVEHEGIDRDHLSPTRWLVPRSVHKRLDANGRPVLHVGIYRHKLILDVRDSSIPGAGLGVFIRCDSPTGAPFVLRPCDFLDLGPYGPLVPTDIKGRAVQLVKNFLHDWKPQRYSFARVSGDDVDITDDNTGELHQTAQRSVLSYVNEVSTQHEAPTILAMESPDGAIHYLLGLENGVAFKMAPNEELELKIDYGAGYEIARRRHGYPREMAAPVDEFMEVLETFKDILDWTVDNVEEALAFLERTAIVDHERVLLIALVLLRRLRIAEDEFRVLPEPGTFCDNGYTTMASRNIVARTKAVIDRELYQTGDLLRLCHSDSLVKIVMVSHVLASCESSVLETQDDKSLREHISNM